uniref:Small multi-drug export protein n=1 Tax=Schlesneria paludicola TaxID=360056 RepID=A0A7C2JYA1_9PLAN
MTTTSPLSAKPPPGPTTASGSLDRAALLKHFQEFELNFRRDHFPLWLGTLIGPWLITAAVIAVLFAVCPPKFMRYFLAAGATSFAFAGRFIIPLQATSQWGPLTPEHMFWMVTYQDVMVALFMAFHCGFLFRLPRIGPKILELTVDGEMILSLQPWMRRLTFIGLVAFIAFPLAATGSVGGAIFGRLLGLSRWATFWGSVIGAVIGNAAMLYGSRYVLRYLPENSLIVQLGGPLLVVAIIIFLERRYARMKREFLKDRPST